jgi:predicted nucleic acid-binding Zn ribbon protein
MTPAGEPSPLGVLLKELFRKNDWQLRLDQHQLFQAWEEIVGAELARRAQPDCIRGEVLWLRVVDSVWMQQLQFQKMMLLETINNWLGEQTLKDIRFRLDMGLAHPPHPEVCLDIRPAGESVTPEEMGCFEEMILPLRDEELKTAMRSLWLKHQGYRNVDRR